MRQSNDAFTRMRRLREALLQTLHSQPRRLARAQAWQPALDLIASEDAYLVRLDVPGVKREQVQASLEDGVLRVRGAAERAPGLEGAQQLRLERVVGPFARSVRLPADADSAQVSARLESGVLTIRVGRRPRSSSRIDIEIV